MKSLVASIALAVLATPAVAQTMPIIIQNGHADRIVSRAPITQEDRITIAVEAACERPFIRNLAARAYYHDCLAEARAQVEALLADRQIAGELAIR